MGFLPSGCRRSMATKLRSVHFSMSGVLSSGAREGSQMMSLVLTMWADKIMQVLP